MGLDLKPLVTPGPIKLSELADKVVAIDAYNTIYQFLSIIRGPTGELLTDSKGEVTSHLSDILYRNANLMMDNIKLIYVFDGKAKELKRAEIERRNNLKKEAAQKYKVAIEEGRMEDARRVQHSHGSFDGQDGRRFKKIAVLPWHSHYSSTL